MTSIGIIGAGQIGRAIAAALARHAMPATLANSRGPDSLAETVAALGPSITAGTREEAAAKDIVIVAVNWSKLEAALAGLPDFGGRVVVDANNPIEAPLFKPFDLGARSSSEVLAGLVPGARIVKALTTCGRTWSPAIPPTAGAAACYSTRATTRRRRRRLGR